MRRKLYFGVALAMAFSLIAGGFLLNHIGAQDAPKKADTEKKGEDLFEILKKKLESKPSTDKTELPLPTPQPQPLPVPPPTGVGSLPPLPALSAKQEEKKGSDAPLPVPPPVGGDLKPLPQPGGGDLKQLPVQNPLPDVNNLEPLPKPNLPEPTQLPAPKTVTTPQVAPPPKKPMGDKPHVIDDPLLKPSNVPQVAPQVDLNPPPMPSEPIKLKGSAWSLHVEMVNGQSIVTATVNKKHEFKIVCESLDLQTIAGTMKATGKVQITGDCLNGSCNQLILPLHDDRLVLEGAADVHIQKVTTNVSDARPATFELKGDKLDLRISELQSAYIETNWRKVSGEATDLRATPASLRTTSETKNWTPYGTLRPAKTSDGNMWSLQSSKGEVIAYVMARDGGSLEQYVGRTIAVFGAREGERAGSPLVRVTHIAVP